MLKIAQLSDIHIGNVNQLAPGIDTKANFLKVMRDVKYENPALVVITGDLGLPEYHGWLKETLEQNGSPYYFALGNHDRLKLLLKYFDLKGRYKNNKLYYKIKIQGLSLYFLDSSSAKISINQLKWLKEECAQDKDEALLFLHYPAVKNQSVFMDKFYPLKYSGKVLSVIQEISSLNHIFCGHYHTEKTVETEGKYFYLTPSTWFQIDRQSLKLKIESLVPGYRIIEWDGKNLKTYVKYIK
jgi:3',5'-cyclic-AMP phosphodiesterase